MQGNKSNIKLLCTQKEGMGTSGENEVKPDYIFKKLVLGKSLDKIKQEKIRNFVK